jgi:uncharacterized membrane protein (DUF106 family)
MNQGAKQPKYMPIIYTVIAALIIGVFGFTAKTVVVSRADVQEQELKKDIKSIEMQIESIRMEHDKDMAEIQSEISQIKKQSVSVDKFDGLCRELERMNQTISLIERRTYEIWKADK